MSTTTRLYSANYASMLIQGIDEPPRPWNLRNTVLSKITATTTMLDIGSGDAKKMIPLAAYAQHISAMEPSPAMRALAHENIAEVKANNIDVVDGKCDDLPFPDNTFDLVTCTLAPWNYNEVSRVLKPGGYFINEAIACEDKLEFKTPFGKDKVGQWRGHMMAFDNDTFIHNIRSGLNPFFTDISITNGYWYTYYTKQGLIELCECTPTIAEFDLAKDLATLEQVAAALMTEKGIKIRQNRVLVIAKKVS